MEATMTLHDHIQQLRAELSACCDAREIALIQRELQAAQAEQAAQDAEFAAWLEDG
jgi:hypothetical protein